MSDKDRQKKDGQRQDKKNQAMREAENDKDRKAKSSQQAKDTSNLTDTPPGSSGNPQR